MARELPSELLPETAAASGTVPCAMRLTRHVPEAGGVVTLHCDQDGWRAELTHGATTELAPLPRLSAADALDELGLDSSAPWAREFADIARRQCTAGEKTG